MAIRALMERERECVCVSERERERESACVRECVCEREKERDQESLKNELDNLHFEKTVEKCSGCVFCSRLLFPS